MADSFDVSILDYSDRKSKRRRKKKDELLDVPESQSLLGRAGGAALSGLAMVGNVLDVPGSMVRDLVSLENPFDQLMSPWSDKNRVTGRDLNRRMGLAGPKDSYANWWGGFATEIATDPLTYLTGGLTKAGQVAAKAGISTTDDVLRAAGKLAAATAADGADDLITEAGKAATFIGKRKAFRTTTPADILRGAGDNAKSLDEAFDVAARSTIPGIDDARIAALKNEKLSTGGIGFKVPFGPKFEIANPQTPLIGGLIEKGADVLDLAGDAVKYGKYSPIRPLIPIFSKAVRGATTKVGQMYGRQADAAARTGEVAARGEMAPIMEAFEQGDLFNAEKLMKGGKGMDLPTANKTIADRVNHLLRYTEGVGDDVPGELSNLKPHLDKFKVLFADDLAKRKAIGLPGVALRDWFAEHFPRQKHFFDPGLRQKEARAAAALPTEGGGQMARDKVLKDLPGATAVLNDISLDPEVSGKAWKHGTTDPLIHFQNKNPLREDGFKQQLNDAMRHIAAKYPEALKPSETMVKLLDEADEAGREAILKSHTDAIAGLSKAVQAGFSLDDLAEKFDVKALKELAKDALHFDPRHVRTGQPLYDMNMTGVAMNRLTATAQHLASGHAIHDLLSTVATVGGDGIPLKDALRRAGFETTTSNAANYQLGKLQREPRFKKMFDDMAEELIENSEPGNIPDLTEEMLKRITVPAEYVKESERLMKAFSAPQEVGALVEVADKVQRLFKSAVTSIFPAFHVRNAMNALSQLWMIDAGDPRYFDPVRKLYVPISQMDEVLKGGVIKDAAEIPAIKAMGITDNAAATRLFQREVFKHGVISQSLTDDAGDMMAPLASQMPGLRPSSISYRSPIKSAAKVGWEAVPKSLEEAHPLNMAGVRTEMDVNSVVKAGRMVGNYTEHLMRGAGFLGLLRQGYSFPEAAKKIRMAMVDYADLTNTEKTFFRRVAPFYSFSKGAMKFVVDELAKDPAGRLGQVIRASRLAHDPDEMTPDYVAESAAIPLGTAADGTKRYITGLGLTVEDPLSFLGGGFRGAGLEALSRGNPLLKAPLEWATGQSFFQKGPEGGRPLDDLDPTIGRILANVSGRERAVTFPGSQAVEAIAGNSPLSKVLTSVRQATDKRKGIGARATNLLTGVRVSDVSPAVQDSLLREQAQKILKSFPEARTYTQTFVPKDEWAKLAPDERLKVQELTTVLNVLSRRASFRAEQKKKAAGK